MKKHFSESIFKLFIICPEYQFISSENIKLRDVKYKTEKSVPRKNEQQGKWAYRGNCKQGKLGKNEKRGVKREAQEDRPSLLILLLARRKL